MLPGRRSVLFLNTSKFLLVDMRLILLFLNVLAFGKLFGKAVYDGKA